MKANFVVWIELLAIAFFAVALAGHTQEITEVPVETDTFDQSETAIAVDPLENQNLMATWNDFRLVYDYNYVVPGYGFSSDGGYSWTTSYILHPDYLFGYDPSCAFDRYGYAFYCYCASNDDGGPTPVSVSRTPDAGQTWNHYEVHYGKTDKPYMAVDNTGGSYDGRIYVSWTDGTTINAIMFAYSPDQGETWYKATLTTGTQYGSSILSGPRAGAPSPTSPFVHFAVPAVGPDGEVYVAWLHNHLDGTGTIELCKSIDGGDTFGDIIDVAYVDQVVFNAGFKNLRIHSYPTIAVDPNSGYVYVAYVQRDDTDYNIYFTRSTDGGQGWSVPEICTDIS